MHPRVLSLCDIRRQQFKRSYCALRTAAYSAAHQYLSFAIPRWSSFGTTFSDSPYLPRTPSSTLWLSNRLFCSVEPTMEDQSHNQEETNEERRRRLQREAQRKRRALEDDQDREARRNQETMARRTARSLLPDDRVNQIRQHDSESRTQHRVLLPPNRRAEIQQHDRTTHLTRYHTSNSFRSAGTQWWDRIGTLNASEIAKPLGLRWNRSCKVCGIKALTGERIHDQCFVCGPKGVHYQPLLPP
ncbi:hypothetical protein K438DRAFT_1857673, partial [Mycena galopus ATCC 62051]